MTSICASKCSGSCTTRYAATEPFDEQRFCVLLTPRTILAPMRPHAVAATAAATPAAAAAAAAAAHAFPV